MSRPWSMPKPEAFAKLLSGLLGSDVVASSGTPVDPSSGTQVILASFIHQDGTVGALWICDVEFAARAGGCLTRIPSRTVEEGVKNDDISETIMENAYEVANVGSRLFNDCGAPHLRLADFKRTNNSGLPEQVEAMLSKPGKRLDLQVKISGYGTGGVSMLAA